MKLGGKRVMAFTLLVLTVFLPCQAEAYGISGQVLEKTTQIPIEGAVLSFEKKELVSEKNDQKVSTTTDRKGRFHFSLPAGNYHYTLKAQGYKSLSGEWREKDRKPKILYLDPIALPEVLVIAPETTQSRPSSEKLSKDELSAVPGTAGDTLRALQTLPGVESSGDFSDALLVRGAGILDNLFLMDNIPLIFPYHFGGLYSTINSDLVHSIDFSAGGFGPEYGDYYGGVIDITQKDPRSDRWGGRMEVTPLLTEAGLEGPVSSNSSLSISGRRSYLEVFSGLLTGFDPVPSFDDYQVKYNLDLSPQLHMDFQSFGSMDNMGLNLASGFSIIPDSVSSTGDNLIYHNAFDSQGFNLKWNAGDGNSLINTAYHTTFSLGVTSSDFFFNLQSEDFGDRFEWTHQIGTNAELQSGFEYLHANNGSVINIGLLPGQDDLDPFNFLYEKGEETNSTASSNNFSLFFDQKLKSSDQKLEFSIGGRLDYQSYNNEIDPGPRISMDYHFSSDTLLRASYGFYTQQPYYSLYSPPGFGNPHLSSEWAASSVLSLEQKAGQVFSIRLEGYNKDLSRLIELNNSTNYSNSGSGYSRGMEVFLRFYPTDRFLGWVSYALSDSERKDTPTSPMHPYIYDQPNVLTAVANFKITSRWDAGLKWHYATGSPYTPVIGSNINVNGGFIPIYGPEDSARLPNYMRLDFSTSLNTVYPSWQLRLFLEVWNVTNNQNIETYAYNANYSQTQPLTEFPLLPYLGFEVSF